MMVSRAKRHLVLRGNVRAGCGLMRPRFRSNNPDEVTCLACQKSIQMADAIALRHRRNNPTEFGTPN